MPNAAVLYVSHELIPTLFSLDGTKALTMKGLPEGSRVRRVFNDPRHDRMGIVFNGPNLPQAKSYHLGDLPVLDVQVSAVDIGDLKAENDFFARNLHEFEQMACDTAGALIEREALCQEIESGKPIELPRQAKETMNSYLARVGVTNEIWPALRDRFIASIRQREDAPTVLAPMLRELLALRRKCQVQHELLANACDALMLHRNDALTNEESLGISERARAALEA